MKKILITVWTLTLGFVANAADSLESTSNVSSRFTSPLGSSTGDGTGTCLVQRGIGDGTATCISIHTRMELVQLNRLRVSLKERSPEEKAIILNKLEEILNDDISN